MALFTVTNTFVAGTTANASQVNVNFSDILTVLNNIEAGTQTWSHVNVTSTDATPVTIKSSAATTEFAVDNTATDGDPIHTFKLGGTTIISMGVDDSDSDKFKIGTTAITTNTSLTIPTAGNAVYFADGAVGSPSIGYSSEPGLGLYRSSANVLGVASNGTNVALFKYTGASILGTTTNDSAAAGYVGEAVSSAVALGSAVSMTGSNQWVTVTSISLTAGDWDISAIVGFTLNGATVSYCSGGVGTANGNDSSGLVNGDTQEDASLPVAAFQTYTVIPGARKSISGTTTYYLKAVFTYSAGTPKAFGRLSARRVR